MAKTIAIFNQKGGVGKTTTNINLSACLAQKGKKILVLDIDPQGNTTSGLGISKKDLDYTVYDLLVEDDIDPRDVIIGTGVKNLDIIPANVDLAGAEIELVQIGGREKRLKQAMDQIREDYDYIFVDCPPSLSSVVINVLSGVDRVLIPIEAADSSVEGLRDVLSVIRTTKRNQNSNLQIDGIIFTKAQKGTKACKKAVESVLKTYDGKIPIFDTMIYNSTRMGELPAEGKSIFTYDPRSNSGEDYKNLVKEYFEYAEEN